MTDGRSDEAPEPAANGESRLARTRRRLRRKVLRLFEGTILALYRLISFLDRAAPPERRFFRVAIFGSSRIQTDDEHYRTVCRLARSLSFIGCDIVTGGGPGLMRAANEGARHGAYLHRTRSFGLKILLPIEEQPNPFLDEVAEHKTFFSRLHQFIRLSHAYVVVDGGIGTTLEALMVWQLLQVGLLEDRTLIFFGPMWKGLRDWIAADVVGRGLASPRDLERVFWVDDLDQVLALVAASRDRFLARHEVTLPPGAAPGPGSPPAATAPDAPDGALG